MRRDMNRWEDWFAEHKDEMADLLKSDAEEALFRAYLAGMDHMGDFMTDHLIRQRKDVDGWIEHPDRMGGQFTDEEIRRSERGGEGW